MMYAMSSHGPGGGIFELGAELRNLDDVEEGYCNNCLPGCAASEHCFDTGV
jgi:hypothetical protein